MNYGCNKTKKDSGVSLFRPCSNYKTAQVTVLCFCTSENCKVRKVCLSCTTPKGSSNTHIKHLPHSSWHGLHCQQQRLCTGLQIECEIFACNEVGSGGDAHVEPEVCLSLKCASHIPAVLAKKVVWLCHYAEDIATALTSHHSPTDSPMICRIYH